MAAFIPIYPNASTTVRKTVTLERSRGFKVLFLRTNSTVSYHVPRAFGSGPNSSVVTASSKLLSNGHFGECPAAKNSTVSRTSRPFRPGTSNAECVARALLEKKVGANGPRQKIGIATKVSACREALTKPVSRGFEIGLNSEKRPH